MLTSPPSAVGPLSRDTRMNLLHDGRSAAVADGSSLHWIAGDERYQRTADDRFRWHSRHGALGQTLTLDPEAIAARTAYVARESVFWTPLRESCARAFTADQRTMTLR